MSTLKSALSLNRSFIDVTRLTSQSGISAVPAAPHTEAPPVQQLTPVFTALRQLFTAVCRSELDANEHTRHFSAVVETTPPKQGSLAVAKAPPLSVLVAVNIQFVVVP